MKSKLNCLFKNSLKVNQLKLLFNESNLQNPRMNEKAKGFTFKLTLELNLPIFCKLSVEHLDRSTDHFFQLIAKKAKLQIKKPSWETAQIEPKSVRASRFPIWRF